MVCSAQLPLHKKHVLVLTCLRYHCKRHQGSAITLLPRLFQPSQWSFPLFFSLCRLFLQNSFLFCFVYRLAPVHAPASANILDVSKRRSDGVLTGREYWLKVAFWRSTCSHARRSYDQANTQAASTTTFPSTLYVPSVFLSARHIRLSYQQRYLIPI